MHNFTFGEMLKKLRISRNLSGIVVAEAVGITATYLYQIEGGKRGLDAGLLLKLADYYNVPSDLILGRDMNEISEELSIVERIYVLDEKKRNALLAVLDVLD